MLIVTSVYKASYKNLLDFSIKYNLDLLVYNKNDLLKDNDEIVTVKTDKLTVIDIPNYGRCDYAFLYYIIKNYKNLPDKVFFTKANYIHDIYSGIDIDIEKIMQLENYNFLLIGRQIKYGIFNVEYNVNSLIQRGVNMNDIECFFDTRETMKDPCFQSYLTRDFYNMVYGDKEYPKEEIVQLGHGPCFVVTKELILQHSITIYEKLIDTFYPNNGHWTEWKDHSVDETYFHLGKRYHDNLLRFWTILFVPNYSNTNIKTDYNSYIMI